MFIIIMLFIFYKFVGYIDIFFKEMEYGVKLFMIFDIIKGLWI